ncbi:MAG: hypothetical protein E7299_04300 [Lachnospiraceae bacterium]|nr:hypothetical protein [Lachnospiraceae bacterium]
MKKNEKSFWAQLAICVGLMIIIWGGYLLASKKIALIIDAAVEDDYLWVAQIEEADIDENEFIITGFAFEVNQNAEKGTYRVILRNLDTGEYLFPKMKYTERKDVNCYFQGEYDYLMSGFEASMKNNKLDPKGNYEILIKALNDENAYRIDTYIVEKKIAYVGPSECVIPGVADELQYVINQGKVRSWCPEVGFYAYQYGDELICMMSEDYKLQADYSNRLVVCIGTTQKAKLPAHKVDMGASIDDLEVYFDDTHLYGNYYVQKIKLPNEYAISEIEIGNYMTDHWVWHDCFKPFYDFE